MLSRDSRRTTIDTRTTARDGTRCLASTCPKYCGRPTLCLSVFLYKCRRCVRDMELPDSPPSRAHAHVRRDTDESTPMFPEIPRMTIPEVIAVVALVDPVVFRRMVTIGLEESRRMSVEGMHICYTNSQSCLDKSSAVIPQETCDCVTSFKAPPVPNFGVLEELSMNRDS